MLSQTSRPARQGRQSGSTPSRRAPAARAAAEPRTLGARLMEWFTEEVPTRRRAPVTRAPIRTPPPARSRPRRAKGGQGSGDTVTRRRGAAPSARHPARPPRRFRTLPSPDGVRRYGAFPASGERTPPRASSPRPPRGGPAAPHAPAYPGAAHRPPASAAPARGTYPRPAAGDAAHPRKAQPVRPSEAEAAARASRPQPRASQPQPRAAVARRRTASVRDDTAPARPWVLAHPWATVVGALLVLVLAAAGHLALRAPSVPVTAGAQSAQSRQIPATTTSHTTAAPATATTGRSALTPPAAAAQTRGTPIRATKGRMPAGLPACGALRMVPVLGAGGTAHQPVPGLCVALGNGRSWLVGCASGYQPFCDPVLQSVIRCLRQAGATQRGVVTTSNVSECATKIGKGRA